MEIIWDTLANLITRGGWVMYPLLLMSVVTVALAIERSWFWHRVHRAMPTERVAALAAALRAGQNGLVDQLLRYDKSFAGHLIRQMTAEESTSESVAIEIVEELRYHIERFMATLSTIITAAPLIGILGTVIGIIQSFELLGNSNAITDPREVSAGIAQALITTAAGLVVSLIALFPYMTYKTYVDRTIGQFEVLIAAFSTHSSPEMPASRSTGPSPLHQSHSPNEAGSQARSEVPPTSPPPKQKKKLSRTVD